MLTELKCGKTHVQLFNGDECVATVKNEYAASVKYTIEEQIGIKEKVEAKGLAPIANRDDIEEKE